MLKQKTKTPQQAPCRSPYRQSRNDPRRHNNGWTNTRRKKQAAAIRQNKPWDKSTGPQTCRGKNRAKMNALRHGLRSEKRKEFNALMRKQRDFVRLVRKNAKAGLSGKKIMAIALARGFLTESTKPVINRAAFKKREELTEKVSAFKTDT